MRAAPSTAANAGKIPVGTPTAWAAPVDFEGVLLEPELVADCFAVDAPEPGVLPPAEVGPTPPEAEPLEPPPGDAPPAPTQLSPAPVTTVKGALWAVRPVLSLRSKTSDAPRVALTFHVSWVTSNLPKSTTGVALGGFVTTVTK